MKLEVYAYSAVSFLVGCSISLYIIMQHAAPQYVPTTLVQGAGAVVPTVHIEGIYNQQLRGSTHGNVRFVLGSTPQALTPNTSFSIPAGPLLTHHVTIDIPKGMQFVASKRGKKYYSVYSKSAQRIAPSNRIYFGTSVEAEAVGYMP